MPMKRISTLLMLHGSRGTHQELRPLVEALPEFCRPILLNLLGHGGRDIPDEFTVKGMAEDVLEQLDAQGIKSTYCFGYSFGGYVALYLARHFPERITGVCTLATKVNFDEQTVSLWTRLSGVQRIRNLQRDIMDQRHPGQNWDRLVGGLANLYRRLGATPELSADDFARITVPSLIISADKDQLVPWPEALALAYSIPNGQGFTFAGMAHPFSIIPPQFLASVIGKWLASREHCLLSAGGGQ